MEKYRSFIMFGVAILIAIIATVLIVSWLQTKTKREAAPLETQDIATAKIDLNWGTALTKEVIEMKPFLKQSLSAGYFSDASTLVGRVIIFPVKANEPISESKLAPINVRTGGVAAVITPKKRAIAVKVDKVIGVAGFIYPGSRVDVLVSLAQGKSTTPPLSTTPVTKTILENILVLAAGPETEAKGKGEKAAPVDVITVEVTPEEAEKLALAATEGRILMVLRNFTDTEDVLTKGETIPALLGSYAGVGPTVTPAKVDVRKEARPRPVVLERPLGSVVELIKGGKVSEVKVEGRE